MPIRCQFCIPFIVVGILSKGLGHDSPLLHKCTIASENAPNRAFCTAKLLSQRESPYETES